MKINARVQFDNAQLMILESVLDVETYSEAQKLFIETKSWSDSSFLHYPGRRELELPCKEIDAIQAWAKTTLVPQVSDAVHRSVELTSISAWWDQAGYKILPHTDLPGIDLALQVYVPDPNNFFQMLGTSFYRNTRQISGMFELHYSPNTGYLLENPWAVIHGLNHGIPIGHDRRSLYFRFR
jgi:hypothetical protein